MTNPIDSVFTVTVQFHGKYYDAKIKPTMDGQPLPWMPDRVDVWNTAETTHKLFSKKIEDMLNKTNIPADRSLEGVITSVDNFDFATPEAKAETQVVWNTFIDCLQHTAAYTTRMPPVNGNTGAPRTVLGAEITLTPNVYRNLTPEEQKATRRSLYVKKMYEYSAQENGITLPSDISRFEALAKERGIKLPSNISRYEPDEKACLDFLVYSDPLTPKLTPKAEAWKIWLTLSKLGEIDEMSRHKFAKNIRELMEATALKKADAEASANEPQGLWLPAETDSESDEFKSLSSSDEGVASGLPNTAGVDFRSAEIELKRDEFESFSFSEEEVASRPQNTAVVVSGSGATREMIEGDDRPHLVVRTTAI